MPKAEITSGPTGSRSDQAAVDVKKGSLYPKRFAPGALIFSFTEGLIILSGCIHGVGLALVSVDNMTFKRPLFAGDTMEVQVK